MRPTLMLLAARVAVASGAARTAFGQTVAPVSQLLPAPERDTMVRVCSACHSPEIAATQRLSRQGWSGLVDTMASRGAQASDAEFKQIVDYLARSFPDKAPTPSGSTG